VIDLAPDYLVEAVVGRGGMGTVYRARDRHGGLVAIKVLDHAADDARHRFGREIDTLAGLRHPAIVGYLDHGARAGIHYLVTEWLDGVSLAEHLVRARLDLDAAVALIRRIAEALALVHARGVVHRDLKPSNLFLVGGDPAQVKLLDFGIAFVDGPATSATRTGTLLGTPEYMAPEQARGERGVDARADVFALGCVLYEVLTGVSPFRGDHLVGVLGKILFAEPTPIDALAPDAPAALCALVSRMLAKDRRARPADGGAIVEALDALRREPGAPAAAGFATRARALIAVVVAAPRTGLGATAPDSLATVVDARPALALLRTSPAGAAAAFEQLPDGAIIATVIGARHPLDQAAAAARCALTMRAALGPGPIAAAAGISEVAGGGIADVIDQAVALLGDDDVIRVDPLLAELLADRFDITPAPPVLRGPADDAPPPARDRGLVGRARELAALTAAYAAAVEDPGARAIVVTGPAGIGKSRLRHALIAQLAAEQHPPAIWLGRGDPVQPEAALGATVRRALGIAAAAPPAALRAALDARLAAWFDSDDRLRIAAFLGELLGPDPDEREPRVLAARRDRRLGADQLRRAWLDWLAAEVAARPLVIALDDLQWFDAAGLAHLDAALAALADRPLLVVGFARPELATTAPGLWRDRAVDRALLGPLAPRAAAELVAAAGVVDPARRAQIIELADGNPRFLEALVAVPTDDLPASLIAIVHARIEALDPPARRALRTASLFGAASWPEAIAEVAGAPLAEVRAALAGLVEADLLVRRPDSRVAGLIEYGFRTALIERAAALGLTDGDRAIGGRAAAAWLARR
jgi:hypothetical protein